MTMRIVIQPVRDTAIVIGLLLGYIALRDVGKAVEQ